MTDFSFRDSLLKQDGETPVDVQLKVIDDIVTADRQYVRRLTIWTIAVWATWVAMIALGLGLPMVLAEMAPRTAGPPQEPVTATTTLVPSNSAGSMRVVAATLAVAVFAVFCFLPIVGVILLVMMIAARRSATISQIQASLASIDAQLKQILSQKTSSTHP